MCGIGLLAVLPVDDPAAEAAVSDDALAEWNDRLSAALERRGPDLPSKRCQFGGATGDDEARRWSATLHASVLHMRGRTAVAQPVAFPAHDSDGASAAAEHGALCWNGECYTYVNDETITERNDDGVAHRKMVELLSSTDLAEEESDTLLVSKLIDTALERSREGGEAEEEHGAIAKALGRIHGEFAFILFVPSPSSDRAGNLCKSGHIYYGRDRLGRRSLLVSRSRNTVALSSVAVELEEEGRAWEEIPPGIVYKLDLCTGEETSRPIPRVVNGDVMAMQPIQQSDATPDAEESSTEEERANCNAERSNLDASKGGDAAVAMGLLKLLDNAVKRRVSHAPPPQSGSADDASVAVLFSGGIDSVVLAALCHRHVPPDRPIDLINVSFYTDANYDLGATTSSPDRLAAILSYREMRATFPDRRWRFVAVDVPYRAVLEHEGRVRSLIAPLDSTMDFNIGMAFYFLGRGRGRVLTTEEVEAALKGVTSKTGVRREDTSSSEQPLLRFAAGKQVSSSESKGRSNRNESTHLRPNHQHDDDIISNDPDVKPSIDGKVTSTAKILLSGVGADEQMAGYGRHRTTHRRGGYDALRTELEMEVKRLWTRNLGRDDRCLSDHGKEARFPYLDEDVLTYLEALPLDMKCDMTLPPGEGDKLILRKVARMIGVLECSSLVKRAIQFGSRIAKVSDKSRFGSCRKATGQSKILPDQGPDVKLPTG